MATETIKTITKLKDTPQYVYNLEVEGNNNYFIEDILVHNSKIAIQDESCLIPDPIEATVFRMIAGKGEDAFYCKIGNPFYRNHFMRSFRDEKYHKIFIDYEQGIKEGRYTKEFIDEAQTKPYFDVLFECKFPKADAIDASGYSTLIGEDFLYSKMREIVPIVGELRWACDVAGEGSNYSVIVERGKGGARILYKENNPDTMNFVGVIAQMFREAKDKPRKIYVDKVGIGKPVFDRLREFPELNLIVRGIMAGEKPQDETNFFNRKAEMFWRLKEWLGIGELLGKDWLDLLDIKYKIQSDRKVKIKSKDEMMKDGIMSPDVADALSFTFYEREVVKPFGLYQSPRQRTNIAV